MDVPPSLPIVSSDVRLRDFLEAVVAELHPDSAVVGLTATPPREYVAREAALYRGLFGAHADFEIVTPAVVKDGFLAPYRVHRVVTEWDAAGWRPSKDELDRYGRSIPDDEYHTKDFERLVALRARTEAIKRHHYERLEKIREISRQLGPASVEDISKQLFRQRSWGPMAESETYAHLEHLRLAGQAESRREGEKLIYTL